MGEPDPREAIITALTEAITFAMKAELPAARPGDGDVISIAQRGRLDFDGSSLFTLCVVFLAETEGALSALSNAKSPPA